MYTEHPPFVVDRCPRETMPKPFCGWPCQNRQSKTLDFIHQFGGLQIRSMLLSSHPIPNHQFLVHLGTQSLKHAKSTIYPHQPNVGIDDYYPSFPPCKWDMHPVSGATPIRESKAKRSKNHRLIYNSNHRKIRFHIEQLYTVITSVAMIFIYNDIRRFHFNRVFHYKLSIWGYPYFRKPPYIIIDLKKKVQGGAP